MKKLLATILALVMAVGVTTISWAAIQFLGGILPQSSYGKKRDCQGR